MQAQDVQDVILLNTLLAVKNDTPTLIARLIDWKNGVDYDEVTTDVVYPDEGTTAKPKAKRTKASEAKFEPTPDPSESSDSEPDF
jgi:hypothetical protein